MDTRNTRSMKWVLIVYFMTATGWQTAESLKMDGWDRVYYQTDEECLTRQHEFTANVRPYADRIRAQCEHIGSYP